MGELWKWHSDPIHHKSRVPINHGPHLSVSSMPIGSLVEEHNALLSAHEALQAEAKVLREQGGKQITRYSEACQEIATLRAELERLREALRKQVIGVTYSGLPSCDLCGVAAKVERHAPGCLAALDKREGKG